MVTGTALPPADILDLGTGTGQVSLLLAELGHRVTGTDLAEGMLDLARRKAHGLTNPPTLLSGDAVDPAFAPRSFDVVTTRYLLWTLREPARALANWRALLRPGGRLVVVDSTWHDAGLHAGPEPEPGSEGHDFRTLYDRVVAAALPLAEATDIEATAQFIRDSGYVEVGVNPLPEVLQAEVAAVDPDVETRLQYLISARVS